MKRTITKRTIAIILALMLVVTTLVACNDPSSGTDTSKPEATEPTTEAPATEPAATEPGPTEVEPTEPEEPGLIGEGLKAAMILPGPISDIGFSGPAYDGLVRIEKELGYEISFAESVAAADYENVFRTYAADGFDIIFAQGAQFLETAMLVADDYPDTWFAISSAFATNEKNISGWNLSSYDVGFLVGILAAQLTETNKIGNVSGAELPPLVMINDGIRAGAAYINPDVEVINIWTSATADNAQTKEAGVALLDSGCDILHSSAGVGTPGVVSAAAEAGKYLIANSADWTSVDPDTVLTSAMAGWSTAVYNTAVAFAKGELQPRPYMNGIAEGAVYMADYTEKAREVIPEEVFARMDEIIDGILAGDIVVADEVAKLPQD